MVTTKIRIDGMTCVNCQNRIEKKLKGAPGVEDVSVSFSSGTATVTYDASVITISEIGSIIEELDYKVVDENRTGAGTAPAGENAIRVIGTLVIILALYMILRQISSSSLAASFPLAEAGMGYGMIFIIGLITSVHCIAMCGGINLSQTLGGGTSRTLLYNGGRVISYTVVGAAAGALGQLITPSGTFKGIVQLAAGVFMVIMGLNMLGLFPALRRFNIHMPKFFAGKIDEQKAANRGPFVIGLLNGLMPCGPLQAMQLYALSSGSPLRGGLSMLLFSLGTVPLMFGLGALSSFLSNGSRGRKITAAVMKVGAVLVAALGLTMFSNGWVLSGVDFNIGERITAFFNPFTATASQSSTAAAQSASVSFTPVIERGVQIVNSSLSGGRYPAITVQQGIPVKWIIDAPQGSINGCNNQMIIREYGIEYRFQTGENVIEFMPEKEGRFSYSCWMGMIRSSITVVAAGQSPVDVKEPETAPVPAGVIIPTETIAVAEMRDGGEYQWVVINLRDDGIEPAVIVVQEDVPTQWIVNNDSLDPGNSRLVFPAYYTQFDMEQGDNEINLLPTTDFDFSTVDNIFYGYVKVVEDITNVNIGAIKAEVGNYETLMYPDAYFEAAFQGAGCCSPAR